MNFSRNRWVLLHHQVGDQFGDRGDHFDFMLAPVGVSLEDSDPTGSNAEDVKCLWAWAIPTNPLAQPLPLECSAERLPDHRAAYLEYEGPISGDRGHVDRVASGSYEVIRWSEERIELRVQCSDADVTRTGGLFSVSLNLQGKNWHLCWSTSS